LKPGSSDHAKLVICDQTIDVTYIRLGQGFVFLAILLDMFTRAIRGWHLSTACDTELTLTALHMALADRVPEIHHSDQSGTYAAHAYVDELGKYQIQISMAAVGKAEENGYAERFMRTIKEEEVDLSDYQDFADARNQIGFLSKMCIITNGSIHPWDI
jgi:putative transposase